jgi:hypothetical protein
LFFSRKKQNLTVFPTVFSISSGQVWNLLTALALPACGFVGVRDKNLTCLQYFCCCNYLCSFFTFVSFISAMVLLVTSPSGNDRLW